MTKQFDDEMSLMRTHLSMVTIKKWDWIEMGSNATGHFDL
jgi:hypothetical protein